MGPVVLRSVPSWGSPGQGLPTLPPALTWSGHLSRHCARPGCHERTLQGAEPRQRGTRTPWLAGMSPRCLPHGIYLWVMGSVMRELQSPMDANRLGQHQHQYLEQGPRVDFRGPLRMLFASLCLSGVPASSPGCRWSGSTAPRSVTPHSPAPVPAPGQPPARPRCPQTTRTHPSHRPSCRRGPSRPTKSPLEAVSSRVVAWGGFGGAVSPEGPSSPPSTLWHCGMLGSPCSCIVVKHLEPSLLILRPLPRTPFGTLSMSLGLRSPPLKVQ